MKKKSQEDLLIEEAKSVIQPSNFADDNRIIYVNNEFDEESTEHVVNKLLQYECSKPGKDILMFIDSYGGNIDGFIAIHDTIKLLTSPIATICVGKAMSCGQMLLISGTKGKRFITPHSRVLIHEIASFNMGKLAELENEYNETKRLQKIFEKLITKYTKIQRNELKEIMKRDTYINAEEALKYGIVDHIIDRPGLLGKFLK